jgi:hypothetical protein
MLIFGPWICRYAVMHPFAHQHIHCHPQHTPPPLSTLGQLITNSTFLIVLILPETVSNRIILYTCLYGLYVYHPTRGGSFKEIELSRLS